MSWATYFDDTFWTPDAGSPFSWDGTKWVCAATSLINLGIVPTGTWANGFRPVKIRLTVAMASGSESIELDTFDVGGSDYIITDLTEKTITTTPTPYEYDLTFPDGTSASDIGLIQPFQSSDTTPWELHITNIEFDTAASPAEFWQHRVKATETDA